MFKPAFLITLMITSATAHADIYKCTINGSVTYKSSPCRGQSTLVKVDKAPSSTGGSGSNTSFALLEKYELERTIKSKQSEIEKLLRKQNKELRKIQIQKSYASNNLAGATWEQSLSTEMTAITAKYKTKIDVIQKEIERMTQKLAEMNNP